MGTLGTAIDAAWPIRAPPSRAAISYVEARASDAPRAHEIVVAVAVPLGRAAGGLQASEIKGEDGLRSFGYLPRVACDALNLWATAGQYSADASTLFLVAAGLSFIFGVTRIVNFAHGSFSRLGYHVGVQHREPF